MNTEPMATPLTDAELAAREAELHAQALAACVAKAEAYNRRNDHAALIAQIRAERMHS